MTEDLKLSITDKNIVISKNILIYSTDEEMTQLRDIRMCIGKRYKKDELPPLAERSGETIKKPSDKRELI